MSTTTTTSNSPAGTASSIPSLKDLASSNATLRRKNLAVVLEFLDGSNDDNDDKSRLQLDSTQCLQLWRGLSVALYMHDTKKMVIVQQLIATLAGTVDVMYARDLKKKNHSEGAERQHWNYTYTSTWTSAFWETMAREWNGIDQWRINKYLLLVRLVIRAVLGLVFQDALAVQGVNTTSGGSVEGKSLLDSQLDVLERWPLSSKERKVPDGLRLHVLDVWVEEVDKAAAAAAASGEEKAETDETNQKEGPSRKRKRKSADEEERGKDKEDKDEQKKKQIKQVRVRLMQPIRRLAKEALGKGVKVKAREIVSELDSESGDK